MRGTMMRTGILWYRKILSGFHEQTCLHTRHNYLRLCQGSNPAPSGVLNFTANRLIHSSIHLAKKHVYPPLIETELEENFVRGSGPGGQSVNKTTNCVNLKHIPSGVLVKCHESRSLVQNRQYARVRLQEKLDWFYNKEKSVVELKKAESRKERKKKTNKTNERLEKLRAFKEREGLT